MAATIRGTLAAVIAAQAAHSRHVYRLLTGGGRSCRPDPTWLRPDPMTVPPAPSDPVTGIATQADPARSPLADLPPPDTRRWVVRRKAQVVAAVREGVLSLEDACRRYDLSTEEFRAWEGALSAHGLRGLQTTRLGQYRAKPAQTAAS